jgi:hypothetical protein
MVDDTDNTQQVTDNAASSADAGTSQDVAGQQAAPAADKGVQAGPADNAAAVADAVTEPPKNKFPDDWREELAKDDKGEVDDKKLKFLKRFNSLKDYSESYRNLQQKISAGEFKRPLGKDAKPEEVAEWRKENGIPEKHTDYLENLPDGVVFGEDDMPVLEPFLKDMHSKNVSPDAVQSALSAYKDAMVVQTKLIQERDVDIAAATTQKLMEEWGGDYRANINAVSGLVDAYFPADVQAALKNARLGDDTQTPLMSSPQVLRAFSHLGRLLNPQSASSGGKAVDGIDGIDTQLKEMKARMGTKEWQKDTASQNRYQELVRLREKLSKA